MIEAIYGDVKPMVMLKTKYKDGMVFGWDTETPNYTIRLLSISDGVNTHLFDVSSETILDTFIDFFRDVKAEDIIAFAHNLSFDFMVLLNLDLKSDCPQFLESECVWEYRDVVIRYFNGKPYFGDIKYKDGKIIHLRDTYSYFQRIKLSTLAEALKVGHKLKVDNEDFYSDTIWRDKKFREYAKEDARLTAAIGDKIMEFHAMEDVRLTVSGPQLAMTVFRKNFIPYKKELTPPAYDDLKFWEYSYHGGKNGCYRLTPCTIKNVNLYDINSAYPYAMTQIPSFLNCRYQINKDSGKFYSKYEGIYEISGVSECCFNSTFDHDFTPLKTLDHIWITSYELRSLMQHDCFSKLKIHNSILVIPKSDYNPLGDYANMYYKLKENEPKESPLYLYYKICMLNSLYGKFIERRYDSEKNYSIRGPNYNPAIASLITGYTRAYMHELEHKGNAIHSATDAVFTCRKLSAKKGLGGLSLQASGDLQLLRTKLYMFRDKKGKLIKYALHGFHGTVEQLEKLWKTKKTEYDYKKFCTAGEYFLHRKLKLKLFGFNNYHANLNIDWSDLNVPIE